MSDIVCYKTSDNNFKINFIFNQKESLFDILRKFFSDDESAEDLCNGGLAINCISDGEISLSPYEKYYDGIHENMTQEDLEDYVFLNENSIGHIFIFQNENWEMKDPESY